MGRFTSVSKGLRELFGAWITSSNQMDRCWTCPWIHHRAKRWINCQKCWQRFLIINLLLLLFRYKGTTEPILRLFTHIFSFIFSFCSEQKHYNARFNRFFQLLLIFKKLAEFKSVSEKLPVAGAHKLASKSSKGTAEWSDFLFIWHCLGYL